MRGLKWLAKTGHKIGKNKLSFTPINKQIEGNKMARKRHSAEFKAKVALEAAKEIKTLNELAAQYEVHSVQISQWKKQLLENLSGVFSTQKKNVNHAKKFDELYRQIGEVTVERDWLKKKLDLFP